MTVIPSFDKSLFRGEGDRAPPSRSTVVHAPVDVVLLEGWMLGFQPLDPAVLAEGYARAQVGAAAEERYFLRFSLASLTETNEALRPYDEWWRALDTFIQVSRQGPGASSPLLGTSCLAPFACSLTAGPPVLDAPRAQIVPPALETVFQWRLQQEHARAFPRRKRDNRHVRRRKEN